MKIEAFLSNLFYFTSLLSTVYLKRPILPMMYNASSTQLLSLIQSFLYKDIDSPVFPKQNRTSYCIILTQVTHRPTLSRIYHV